MKPSPILMKFGGKNLYCFVSFCLMSGHLTEDEAAAFLREPVEDLLDCKAENEDLLKAVKEAIQQGVTVDHVIDLESRR